MKTFIPENIIRVLRQSTALRLIIFAVLAFILYLLIVKLVNKKSLLALVGTIAIAFISWLLIMGVVI